MKILTFDNETLYLVRIGAPDVDGCDKLYCKDEQGKNVVITWGNVLCCFGSYSFPPITKRMYEKN